MASKAAIDTNVILRTILNDVPELAVAAENLLIRSGMVFYVQDQVITEAVYVLSDKNYNFSRQRIKKIIEGFLNLSMIECDEELFSEVFELYVKHPKLSFNDCYLACKIKKMGRTPLYSFDKKLVAQVKSVAEVPTR